MHLPILLGLFIQIAFMLHAIKTNKSFNWLLFLLIPWIGSLFYFFIKFLPETLQNQQPFNTEKSLPKQPDTISQLNGKKIVYLTQGKLFHKCDALPLTQISSHFGQKVIDKTLEAHRRNEWKTENTGSPFGGSTLWGANEVNADAIKVDITSVARSDNHEKLYFLLETESTGGLFVFDYKEKDEKRLFQNKTPYGRIKTEAIAVST
ncbi:MAG: hypothetical protein Q3M24_19515 [Candidatus Electrothrix aestuarii]|uniref:Cardiolipin synthase N-terminal domain-containing protein n=1 Tax=Candidatus Electrothrix aestuarii TaxID=3062594 RepID=A0AAU8LT27_9BACT|nr:hypothetical protein [Candidatus Electrothrix aestuarii]